MKRAFTTFGIYVAGISLILLGIIGLVLPILQGVLFIVIGCGILSLRSRKMVRLIWYVKRRLRPFQRRVWEWARQFYKRAKRRV